MITAQQPRVARRQLGLATRHQLTAAGVPDGTITSRTRPGGPWQRLLPRVYLLQTGPRTSVSTPSPPSCTLPSLVPNLCLATRPL